MTDERISKAIWLPPAAAALMPIVLLLAASVTSMTAAEWIRLPFSLPFLALWSLAIGYPIALLHMALARPFYRWLRRRWRVRWWSAALAGGITGAVPVALLQAFVFTGRAGDMLSLGTDGLTPLLAGSGAVGGLVFWRILRASEAEADPA